MLHMDFIKRNNDLQGRHLSLIDVSSEDDSLLFNSSFFESLHHSFSSSKSTTFFFIFELLCMKFFFFFWDCMCEWIWLILLFINKAWFRFLKNFLLQTKPILCKEQKVSDAKLIFVFYTEIECFNSFELSLPREIFFIRWLKSQKLCNLFLVVLYLLVLKWNKSVSFEILGLPFQYCLFRIQFLGQ